MNNTELYIQYAELEDKIAVLEAQKEPIRSAIMANMDAQAINQVKSDYGTFSFMTRRTFQYSPKVHELADSLRATKKHEEEAGAPYQETRSLLYRRPTSA